MTRTHNTKIVCPQCKYEHTGETEFERWVRNNPLLDSRDIGLVRYDLDMLLHRYKFLVDGRGERVIQCMMFIEVKSHNAIPDKAQQDTLSIFNQVLRNRRVNIHSTPRKQAGNITNVYSKMLRRTVKLLMCGGHLLTFSANTPDDSSQIKWDNKLISKDWLIELLRFERDADRPELLMDHRRRYRSFSNERRLFT